MAGADGQAGGEDRFVVVVVAGAVDRELPLVSGADVAEPAELDRGGVSQGRVDVAEAPAVADLEIGDLGPAGKTVEQQLSALGLRPPLTICYEPRTSAALARGRYGPASSPEEFAGSDPVCRADAGTHEPWQC